jgi:hypothetical protein
LCRKLHTSAAGAHDNTCVVVQVVGPQQTREPKERAETVATHMPATAGGAPLPTQTMRQRTGGGRRAVPWAARWARHAPLTHRTNVVTAGGGHRAGDQAHHRQPRQHRHLNLLHAGVVRPVAARLGGCQGHAGHVQPGGSGRKRGHRDQRKRPAGGGGHKRPHRRHSIHCIRGGVVLPPPPDTGERAQSSSAHAPHDNKRKADAGAVPLCRAFSGSASFAIATERGSVCAPPHTHAPLTVREMLPDTTSVAFSVRPQRPAPPHTPQTSMGTPTGQHMPLASSSPSQHAPRASMASPVPSHSPHTSTLPLVQHKPCLSRRAAGPLQQSPTAFSTVRQHSPLRSCRAHPVTAACGAGARGGVGGGVHSAHLQRHPMCFRAPPAPPPPS